MDSLFLWELGTPKVYLIWLLVLAAQIAVAEINRRWNWTIFAVWTVGGIALMPYAWIHGTPMVGWFPFGKYAIMILTATMTGTVLVYAKRNPVKAHKYAIWLGVALWIGLAVNIMEANIRDLTIWYNADSYYACGADWQCLKGVNDAHTIDMIAGLPEARGVSSELHSHPPATSASTRRRAFARSAGIGTCCLPRPACLTSSRSRAWARSSSPLPGSAPCAASSGWTWCGRG